MSEMGKMRRADKMMSEEKTFSALAEGEYGILSTVDDSNQPYGVPVNFCVLENAIYFHSATAGQKIDNFTKNPKVSFCVTAKSTILPDKFDTEYQSVIVFGLLSEVFQEEKQRGLEGLLKKYSPDFFEKGLQYIKAAGEKSRVFKISIETITGKEQK